MGHYEEGIANYLQGSFKFSHQLYLNNNNNNKTKTNKQAIGPINKYKLIKSIIIIIKIIIAINTN